MSKVDPKDECSTETSRRVKVEMNRETQSEQKASDAYLGATDKLAIGILDEYSDEHKILTGGLSHGVRTLKEQNEMSLDGEQTQGDGFELHDDVSSIFSDRESDEKEREILQDALLHLRKDDLLGFIETCSESSEVLSEIESCFAPEEATEHSEAIQVAHGAPVEENDREMVQRTEASSQATEKMNRYEGTLVRSMGQAQVFYRKAAKEESVLSAEVIVVKDPIGGSDSPDSGYISDLLAKENEKLGEVIDHLRMKSISSPQLDGSCLDLADDHVRRERYVATEAELTEMKSKLREKDRELRKQERASEEQRYQQEEECRLLKRSLAEAERKMEKTANELKNCEAKVKEANKKHARQQDAMEGELEKARQQNLKLEETVLFLQKHGANLEQELQEMGQHVVKLQEHEEQVEYKYRSDIRELEGFVEKVSQENEKIKGKAGALQQEVLQAKAGVFQQKDESFMREQKLEPRRRTENDGRALLVSHAGETLTYPVERGGGKLLDEAASGQAAHGGTENTSDIQDKIQEEQRKRKKLEDENRVMSMALKRLSFGDSSQPLHTLLPGEMFGKLDITRIQEKLAETVRALDESQLKNEEGEAEIKRLKRKSERLEKDAAQTAKMESKNEELEEELERTNRRLREAQRTAKSAREEVEEMADIVQKLREQISKRKDEADGLRAEIEHKEELLAYTKSQNGKAQESEGREAALSDLGRKYEDAEKKSLALELENNSLRQGLQNANDKIRVLEERLTIERKELMAEYRKELEELKEEYDLKRDELSSSAKMVREVTEEWQRMLRETVRKNEELLHKAQDEKRQAQEELQRKTEEMEWQLSICRCKLGRSRCGEEDQGERLHSQQELQQKKDKDAKEMQTEALHGVVMHSQEECSEKFRALSQKHEQEMEELKERLDRESKDARQRLKEELAKSLATRSAILERRIEGLVFQKVQQERQRNRRHAAQHQREIERHSSTIGELKTELRRCEGERKVLERKNKDLEVTAKNLKNELLYSKEAEERMINEVRRVEDEFEAEKRKLKDIGGERIEKTKEKIDGKGEEVPSAKNRKEVDFNTAVMVSSFHKGKYTSELDEGEINEVPAVHDRIDFNRALHLSDTLDSLRREIERVRAHWHQLRNGVHSQVEDNIRNTQPAHPENVDAAEIFLLEDESSQQAKREREVLQEKARELQMEVTRLRNQMSEQEVRSRREHVTLRRKFQCEKVEMEDEFRREKNSWQVQMSALATRANLRRMQVIRPYCLSSSSC